MFVDSTSEMTDVQMYEAIRISTWESTQDIPVTLEGMLNRNLETFFAGGTFSAILLRATSKSNPIGIHG